MTGINGILCTANVRVYEQLLSHQDTFGSIRHHSEDMRIKESFPGLTTAERNKLLTTPSNSNPQSDNRHRLRNLLYKVRLNILKLIG
jgi:hypothetical protein